jgi:formylmethanofuran dehydrogenase subunit B
MLRAPAEVLPGLVAALRARVARRVNLAASEKDAVDAIAEGLRRAQFGLVVYSPLSLDTLGIEMLAGLVADLNKATRFSTLSVGGSGNAETLMQTAGWMTGFPARTGFGRGYPEHDPWRFDARRLMESGEADALLWIASAAAEPPAWAPKDNLIALTTADSGLAIAKVHIAVGRHGHDHDAVAFARETQSLAWRRGNDRSNLPSAAVVLEEIAASVSREAA